MIFFFFWQENTCDLMLRRKNKKSWKEISYLLRWQTKCDGAQTIRKSHYLRQLARESQKGSFKILQKEALTSMGKAFKYLAECLLLSSKMYWHCKQDVKKAKKASSDCDRMKFREIIPREMKRMCNSEGGKKTSTKLQEQLSCLLVSGQINYYKT